MGPEPLRDSRLTPFLGVPFVCVVLLAGREFRFTGSGVGGAVSLFTRDDFLTPFSNTVVGPSATKDFQGGDTARDAERRGVASSSFRRFVLDHSCAINLDAVSILCAVGCVVGVDRVAWWNGVDVAIRGGNFFHSGRAKEAAWGAWRPPGARPNRHISAQIRSRKIA